MPRLPPQHAQPRQCADKGETVRLVREALRVAGEIGTEVLRTGQGDQVFGPREAVCEGPRAPDAGPRR